MPKKPTPPSTFTREELDAWGAEGKLLGRPLWSDEDLDKWREKDGTKNIDYCHIDVVMQASRLLAKFNVEDAAQVAKGIAHAMRWNGDKNAERDWLEVEREILKRQSRQPKK